MHLSIWFIPLISVASATSFIERPLTEAVSEATTVVRGTIQKSASDWGKSDEGARYLYTYSELQVSEVMRGKGIGVPSTIQVRSIGGEKDGVGVQVSGTATFSPGEEVVVFLRDRNVEGSYDVDGMMMGKFNVEKDDHGRDTLSGPAISRKDAPKPITLDAFRKLVASGPAPAAGGAPPRSPAPRPSERPLAQHAADSASKAPAEAGDKAPPLQPSASEDSAPSGNSWIAAGLIGLLLIGWAIFGRRKKR